MLTAAKLKSIYNDTEREEQEITDVDGLSVRVSKTKMTYQVRYRFEGKQNRMKLGEYPAMSLMDARAKARDIKVMISGKEEPREVKKKDQVTVRYIYEMWLRLYAKKHRKDIQQLRKSIEKNVLSKVGHRPVINMTLTSWTNVFDEIARNHPVAAGQHLSTAKQVYQFAINRGTIKKSPLDMLLIRDVGKYPEVGDRILSDEEIAKILLELDANLYPLYMVAAINLCLLMGCRTGELRQARFVDFDMSAMVWTVPKENSKTKAAIRRPIISGFSDYFNLLKQRSPYLFPSLKDKSQPVTRLTMTHYPSKLHFLVPNWTMHDLRRTAATKMAELGTAPYVIEKILGHKMGGVLEIYNKHDYLLEQREALERWQARIKQIKREYADSYEYGPRPRQKKAKKKAVMF